MLGWHSEGEGRLARGLCAWIAAVQRFPVITIIACVALAALSAWYSATRMELSTARLDRMDRNDPNFLHWERYSNEFGAESDIVIVVGGRERGMMIAAVETIASELEAYPNHFDKLCYRLDVARLKAKGLYQLTLRELQAIQDSLAGVRPALMGSWDWLTTEGMARGAAVRASNLTAEGVLEDSTRSSLLATAKLLESLAMHLKAGHIYRSPWDDPLPVSADARINRMAEYFFSPDQRFAFLRVSPMQAKDSSLFRNHPSVQILREVLERMRTVYPDLEFELTGIPVLEADEMQAVKVACQWSLLVSSIGVLLILTTAFRTWRHPTFAMMTLAVAGCWTLGFVTFTIGHLNLLSGVVIVAFVGLGMDYAILWMTGFEESRLKGKYGRRANFETARTIGSGTIVGAGTTALAFLTALVSGCLGLVELGCIAASGVLFCLAATMTLLPALLVVAGAKNVAPRPFATPEVATTGPVARWPWTVIVILVLGVGFLIAGLPQLRIDYNPLNLHASELASLEWERRMAHETGTSSWHVLSMANSAEETRRLADEFKSIPSVGRVVEIASLIPADQPAKRPVIQGIHDDLKGLPEQGQIPTLKPPSVPSMLEAMDAVIAAGSRSSLRTHNLIVRLVRGAQEVNEAFASLSTSERSARLAKFHSLWIEDLALRLIRLRAIADPEPVSVQDLPKTLVDRFYSPTGKWAIQVFAKGSVWDMTPLQKFHDDLQAVDPRITGKPISALHSIERMTSGLYKSGTMALVVVFALLWLDMGRFRYALAAMAPSLLGGIAIFGSLGWLGIPLNPANWIALPLILGMGVKFGVHVLHDYRDTNGPYMLRRGLAKAMRLHALTMILSSLSLALSSHWGMATIGIAMAIGIACCAVLALLFLPAVLAISSRHRPGAVDRGSAEAYDLPSTVYYREAA